MRAEASANPYANTLSPTWSAPIAKQDAAVGLGRDQAHSSDKAASGSQESQSDAIAESGLSADQADAELQAKAGRTYLALYIETYGAPEEKEQDRVEEPERSGDDEDEREKIARQSQPGKFLEAYGKVLGDPMDEGKVTVYAVKLDAEGKASITRAMEFDSTAEGKRNEPARSGAGDENPGAESSAEEDGQTRVDES